MKPSVIFLAIGSFLLPIVFVAGDRFFGDDGRPVTGTLTYFYAPG